MLLPWPLEDNCLRQIHVAVQHSGIAAAKEHDCCGVTGVEQGSSFEGKGGSAHFQSS